MSVEVVAVVIFLVLIMLGSLSVQWWRTRQLNLNAELFERGAATRGKVVAINHPIGLPHETHVYFTYEVHGVGAVLQSCSIDLRALRQHHAIAIPNVGAEVQVRYLPEAPNHAVIAQLGPCLAGFAPMPARAA